MSYKIRSTDLSKEFTIENGTVDRDQASIAFIGKNASGYAEYFSENFLHLLENFAGPDQPGPNPIEGQLWYDTSDPFNKKLKISAAPGVWKPVNGVYQQDDLPLAASKGDIWVNTAQAQVFLTLDGSSWTLVGPSFSSTLKSGSYPEEIRDINGELHTVVKNFINDEVVEIVSNTQFTPQAVIPGFTNIKPGVNLSTRNNAAFNATAAAAENIVVTAPNRIIVSGNSLVRNDVNGSINGVLNLRQGLTIGPDPTFLINKIGNGSNVFANTTPDGNFKFTIRSGLNTNEVLTLEGQTDSNNPRPRVGINRPNPTRELDVLGNAIINGSLEVTDTFTVTNKATFGSSVILQTSSTFESTASFVSSIELGTTNDQVNRNMIVPLTSSRYNIGTSDNRFNEVHSFRFFGDLKGTADAASSLTGITLFNINGDIQSSLVSYSGLGGTYTFVTNATTNLIGSKSQLTSVAPSDEILVSVRPATYINIPATGSITGQGASFSVSRSDGVYTSTNIVNTGTGYEINDVLTIPGTSLGGRSPQNDLSIQVLQVSPAGSIIREPGVGFSLLPSTAISGLNKATKTGFLSDILEFLIPPGTIIPYAGLVPPAGWLFCDGSVVDNADYPRLFAAIQYVYGKTNLSRQFLLPDLRGRMIVGYDDMSNGLLSSTGAAGRVPEATSPLNTQGNNPPPTGGSTTATNDIITNQFGGTASGIRANVMNPYLAMNYIIKV
jgi:hypothetical protein